MVWTPPPETASLCQSGSVIKPLEPEGASIMNITTIGIDLAKNVFQIHGVEARGKAVLKRQLRRDQMGSFFANLPACVIGMEADSAFSSILSELQFSASFTAWLMTFARQVAEKGYRPLWHA